MFIIPHESVGINLHGPGGERGVPNAGRACHKQQAGNVLVHPLTGE